MATRVTDGARWERHEKDNSSILMAFSEKVFTEHFSGSETEH